MNNLGAPTLNWTYNWIYQKKTRLYSFSCAHIFFNTSTAIKGGDDWLQSPTMPLMAPVFRFDYILTKYVISVSSVPYETDVVIPQSQHVLDKENIRINWFRCRSSMRKVLFYTHTTTLFSVLGYNNFIEAAVSVATPNFVWLGSLPTFDLSWMVIRMTNTN